MKRFLAIALATMVSLCDPGMAATPSPVPSPAQVRFVRDVTWKDLRIHLEQKFEMDFGTEARIEIRSGTQLIKTLTLNGLQSIGATAGLFIPKKQPLADHFVFYKEGDHDPRILVVDPSGRKTVSLPATELYLSPNGRYVFAFQQSQESALPEYAVYDLEQNQVVMEAKDTDKVEPYFVAGISYQLYAKGGRYLAVARTELAVDPVRAQKLSETSMTEMNLEMKSVKILPLDAKTILEAKPMNRIQLDLSH